MPDAKADLLIIDDDDFYLTNAANFLADRGGYIVHRAQTVRDALEAITTNQFKLVVLDVRMPPGDFFDQVETAGGHKTGVALTRKIRRRLPGVKLIVNTGAHDPGLEASFEGIPNIKFLNKTDDYRSLLRAVNAALDPGFHRMRPFIVHGRDRTIVLELQYFLQNRLGFQEPKILSDMPSQGRTWIEKFEHYAAQADVVFVLITPDDIGQMVGTTEANRLRARQNVIFELGYFLGSLRRRSGRIFLLHKGDVEIPSDLAGIVYIDIEHGIEAAGDRIRRELEALVQSARG